jgi:hypothetical protein
MPRSIVNFDTVRNIGLTFPGVEESTAYASPVLKVHGKILAGIAVNRSAEPGSLMLCLDLEDRAELLAADPDVYYVTDHYVGNAVLVRLPRVNPAVLRDLLGMAYTVCDSQRLAPFAVPAETRKIERCHGVHSAFP